MALQNFSTDLFVLTVNGRNITDWGESDPPFMDDEVDEVSVLRKGLGGNSCRLDRVNPGRRITLNLNPGSADSAFINALMISKATISMGYQQVGTLEGAVGTEGMVVSRGQNGRGGTTISDDQFVMEFVVWAQSTGGD